MQNDDPEDARRDRMTFYPLIVMGAIFCISIFIVIATTFGDPDHPLNSWVNLNANLILITEAVLLVILSIGAMTVDRLRTLKKLASEQKEQENIPEESCDDAPAPEGNDDVG